MPAWAEPSVEIDWVKFQGAGKPHHSDF